VATDPPSLQIRHVRSYEHDRLRELRLASLAADPTSFGATYARDAAQPPDFWRQWARQSEQGTRQRTFVLVDAHDRWLGLALVRFDDERPGAALLNAMWVSPAARGRGGAGALCDACAAWAADRGLREVTLNVLADNATARRAYVACGFVVRGTTTWSEHGRGLHEFIAERPAGPRPESGLRELVMVRPV
jgi:RimJ/RimL family protein N-acetyltransferase